MKTYQKPVVEEIKFTTVEVIATTNDDDWVDGELGIGSGEIEF